MASRGAEVSPSPVPCSVHSITFGHSQGGHSVQDQTADSGFHSLTLQSSGSDHWADEGLVARHLGLNQASFAVPRPSVPRTFSESGSRADAAIALSQYAPEHRAVHQGKRGVLK